MLNSILVNKFPSKDHFLLANNRAQTTTELIKQKHKASQVVSYGCQPKGGVLRFERSHPHVNVRHVRFAKGCKDDCLKKCLRSNDSESEAKCLLDIVKGNDGSGEGFSVNKMLLGPPWQARLSYMLEMNVTALKKIHAKPPDSRFVYLCENQPPLSFGQGPDYSCTFLGIMNDGSGVAVKKINKKRVESLSDEAQRSILSSVNNPSLAKVWFISSDKTHYYIVRELCEHSLAYRIRMRGFIPCDSRPPLNHEGLCYSIACGVAALHQIGLSHKSLKPENIFLTDSGDVKLADYQLHERYSVKKKQYTNVPSSLAWLPSEAHMNAVEFSLASDISSLGMIFYWIITEGGHPFGDHLNHLDTCIKNCKSGRYNLKSLSNPFAHHLLQHMIYKEPEKRLTIGQIIRHPYFWTEDVKIEYLQLIAMTYCGDIKHTWSPVSELKQYLIKKESTIGKSTPKTMKNDQIDFNIEGIMRYIYAGIMENDDNPSIKVLQNWPGFVFETYNQFSIDDLKYAQSTVHLSPSESKETMLKPCLSVDSGVYMTGSESNPGSNDIFAFTDSNQFESRQRFISGDSGCCSYSDPGIDLMSPVTDFSKDESCFEFPDNSKCKDDATTKNSIDKISYKKFQEDFSIAANFAVENSIRSRHSKELSQISARMVLWTDMDELD